MNINRHNYEECFILYWDSELTASQKQAVEDFVKENTDLQEEFRILGETRFTPDKHVQFAEKEFLLNNSVINITSYEEYLLCYIDDEFTADRRKEVERFVSQCPAAQQELALLQKAKLQPEAEIVFPDKSSLYNREEKVRVISMIWFRVAVAAAIILIAGLVTFRLVSTNKGGKQNEVVQSNSATNQRQNNQATKVAKDEKKDSSVQPATTDKKDQKSIPENKLDNTVVSYKPKNKNKLPKEGNRTKQTIANPNTETEEAIASNFSNPISKDNNKAEKSESVDNPSVTLQAGYALNTKPPAPEETEKDGGGLKEFLRKTTRVFERRTKIQTTTEDNKLLLGAFAVSLK